MNVKEHLDICIELNDMPVDKAEMMERWLKCEIKKSIYADYFNYLELNY